MNRITPLLILSCIVAAFAPASFAEGSTTNKTSETPPQSKPGEIENAAMSECRRSMERSIDLSKKMLLVVDRLKKLNDLASSRGKDKPLKETLNQNELDEFNQLTAQIRYLTNEQYVNVLKRRGYLQVCSLAEFLRTQDEILEDLYSADITPNSTGFADEFNKRMAERVGFQTRIWPKALDAVAEAQQTKTALSIPLTNLVERLRNAGYMVDVDDLDLFLSDDYPNTQAAKVFLARLRDEVANGSPGAKEVQTFLLTEWRVGNKQ